MLTAEISEKKKKEISPKRGGDSKDRRKVDNDEGRSGDPAISLYWGWKEEVGAKKTFSKEKRFAGPGSRDTAKYVGKTRKKNGNWPFSKKEPKGAQSD